MRYTLAMTPKPSTIRWSVEDREVLAKLQAVTGLTDSASVVRYALRHTLATLPRSVASRPKAKKKGAA